MASCAVRNTTSAVSSSLLALVVIRFLLADPSWASEELKAYYPHNMMSLARHDVLPERVNDRQPVKQRRYSRPDFSKRAHCVFFKRGTCQYGAGCAFAHSQAELCRTLPQSDKSLSTQLCRNKAQMGYCHYGDNCRFIHSTLLSNLKQQSDTQGILPGGDLTDTREDSTLTDAIEDLTDKYSDSTHRIFYPTEAFSSGNLTEQTSVGVLKREDVDKATIDLSESDRNGGTNLTGQAKNDIRLLSARYFEENEWEEAFTMNAIIHGIRFNYFPLGETEDRIPLKLNAHKGDISEHETFTMMISLFLALGLQNNRMTLILTIETLKDIKKFFKSLYYGDAYHIYEPDHEKRYAKTIYSILFRNDRFYMKNTTSLITELVGYYRLPYNTFNQKEMYKQITNFVINNQTYNINNERY